MSATPHAPPTLPVVVTLRGLEKLTRGNEAVDSIREVANTDPDASAGQRAAAAAAIGKVLNELRRAETAAGALVLSSPQHEAASRLQSLIASGEKATTIFEPLPSGGLEAKFDTGDWIGWAGVAWAKLKHRNKHALLRPASATPEPIGDVARIGIVGDWGTGMYGAPEIAKAIRADPDPFAVLMHLGDVYYSGTTDEMQRRFLDVWPHRREAISRGLNSNHDMYSGGDAYFTKTLPAFNQSSSYFAMQNQHFTLVGLDVAYKDHDIDDEQVSWVEDVLAQAGSRKVIFFSHHQLYSHFDGQGKRLWEHPRFGDVLRSKRVFAWYWGHEHRCSIFHAPDANFGILARCIGHGSMPQSRTGTKGLPKETGADFTRAEWVRSAARTIEGNLLPDVTVLEGRNPFILGEEDKFAPHGYAVLTLDGPTLREDVRDATGNVIYDRVIAS